MQMRTAPCRFNCGLTICETTRGILSRLTRVQQGNYGDVEPIGEGLSELRFFFGSGYRVYFGEDADNIIVILCGGDKDSQSQDIENAKAYWQEYKNNAKT